MELDELKQKWTELSEQVEKNELLNRQIIIDMIQSKKRNPPAATIACGKDGFRCLRYLSGNSVLHFLEKCSSRLDFMVFAGNGDMAFAHADSYVSDYIYLKDSN